MSDFAIDEPINPVITGKRCFFAISSSIIVFFIIIVIGGLILPKNANAWKFWSVADFAICSAVLIIWFPGINTFKKPSYKMLAIAFIAAVGFNYLIHLSGSQIDQNYINEFNSYDINGRIIYVLIICLLAPVFEEIYFRGLLFPIASLRLGAPAGAILSAVLFILGHMSLSVVFITVVYTYLAYRTQSVFPSIFAHISYNSIWIIRALM
jgi:membrane protease YdiL (CAAX protease family)